MKMRISVFAAVMAFAPMVAGMAVASDKNDVMATVKQYDDAFNKGDMKGWSAACTDKVVIIDDFPPHVWQGANACGDWWSAFQATAKQGGMTETMVMLGESLHVAITGDRAYTVYPARFTYKAGGKAVSERGIWTMILQKAAGGWHIAGWAWAQR